MEDVRFEEEEFNAEFNGKVVLRILAQTRPHWRWVIGFLACIALVSAQDSVFTYLSKLIIDEGIVLGDQARVAELLLIYGGMSVVQAAGVLGFIYLAGVLVIVHFVWLSKDPRLAWRYGAVLAVLLALRIPPVRRGVSRARQAISAKVRIRQS